MIHFVLIFNRQRKARLNKWYSPYSQKERTKVIQEISGLILRRGPELCNILEWRGLKVVYKSYRGLYYCMCTDHEDNELETLEVIHLYVKNLDKYYCTVYEWDLIFYFHWAYYVLDEIVIAGELQESNVKTVDRLIREQDRIERAAREEANKYSLVPAETDLSLF